MPSVVQYRGSSIMIAGMHANDGADDIAFDELEGVARWTQSC